MVFGNWVHFVTRTIFATVRVEVHFTCYSTVHYRGHETNAPFIPDLVNYMLSSYYFAYLNKLIGLIYITHLDNIS